MITILLIDDHSAVRQGLHMRLAMEPGVAIVGDTGDGQSAIDLFPVLKPDVVVMDIEMPGMNGITTARTMRSIAPRSAIVILTM